MAMDAILALISPSQGLDDELRHYAFLYAPILVLATIYLFAVMSVAAYDFLSPNLGHISSKTKLPESLIGVTFMAFGNASADIVSSFIAIKTGNPSLAIGSIIGAAIFVSGVVIGSLGIVGTFVVQKRQFLRDAIFLLAAAILLMFSVADGVITFAESLRMVALYVVYAFVVVNFDDRTPEHEIQQESFNEVSNVMHIHPPSPSEESTLGSPMFPRPDSHTPDHSPHVGPIRPSLYSAIEFRDHHPDTLVSSPLHHNNWQSETNNLLLHPHSSPRGFASSPASTKGLSPKQSPFTHPVPSIVVPSQADQRDTQSLPTYHATSEQSDASKDQLRSLPKLVIDTNSLDETLDSRPRPALAPGFSAGTPRTPSLLSRRSSMDAEAQSHHEYSLTGRLFPGIIGWEEKRMLSKINSILMAPGLLLLTSSIPIAESNIDVNLLEIHSIVSPCVFLVLCLPIDAISLGITLLVVLALFHITSRYHEHIPNLYITIAGFFMSIVWVVRLANKMVDLIETLGELLSISDAVLGLTIVAIGNSSGDLVSNISLAKLSYSTMALAASLSSPLLNLMLGIGGSSFALMLIRGTRTIDIPISPSILASGSFLIVNLSVLLIFIPLNNWKMTPQIGCFGILLWVVSVFVNLYLYEA